MIENPIYGKGRPREIKVRDRIVVVTGADKGRRGIVLSIVKVIPGADIVWYLDDQTKSARWNNIRYVRKESYQDNPIFPKRRRKVLDCHGEELEVGNYVTVLEGHAAGHSAEVISVAVPGMPGYIMVKSFRTQSEIAVLSKHVIKTWPLDEEDRGVNRYRQNIKQPHKKQFTPGQFVKVWSGTNVYRGKVLDYNWDSKKRTWVYTVYAYVHGAIGYTTYQDEKTLKLWQSKYSLNPSAKFAVGDLVRMTKVPYYMGVVRAMKQITSFGDVSFKYVIGVRGMNGVFHHHTDEAELEVWQTDRKAPKFTTGNLVLLGGKRVRIVFVYAYPDEVIYHVTTPTGENRYVSEAELSPMDGYMRNPIYGKTRGWSGLRKKLLNRDVVFIYNTRTFKITVVDRSRHPVLVIRLDEDMPEQLVEMIAYFMRDDARKQDYVDKLIELMAASLSPGLMHNLDSE